MKKIFIYLLLPFIFLLNSCGSTMISKFEIETQSGLKKPINILREDYNLMISENKSFILYIASSTCSSCKKFSTTALNPYIKNTGVVIYRIETYHIDDVINYYATPAISVIKKGEVVNTINMAKNEKHFKSEESIKKYIERYVTYGSAQKYGNPKYITKLGEIDTDFFTSDEGTNELISMFENKQTFVVIFAGENCSNCKSFNSNVLNPFLGKYAGKQYRDYIYYYYSNEFVEYLNDLNEDGKEARAEAKQLAEKYEGELMIKHYIPAYEEFYNEEYNTKSTVGNIEFYTAETPSILYVVNGEVMGMLFGDISGESDAISLFSETLSAWKDNDSTKFKEVLEKIY